MPSTSHTKEIESLINSDLQAGCTKLQEILKSHPPNIRDYTKCIQLLLNRNHNLAKPLLDSYFNDLSQPWISGLWAIYHQKIEDWDQAIKLWESAAQRNPKNRHFLFNYLMAYPRAKRHSEFADAVESMHSHITHLLPKQQYQILSELLDLGDSSYKIHRLRIDQAQSLSDHYRRLLKYKEKELELGIDAISIQIEKEWNDVNDEDLNIDLFNYYGEVLDAKERWELLSEVSLRAIKLYPSAHHFYAKAMKAAKKMGKYELYDQVVEQAFANTEYSSYLFIQYSEHLNKKGDRKKAKEVLRNGIQQDLNFKLKQSTIAKYSKMLLQEGELNEFVRLTSSYKDFIDIRLYAYLLDLYIHQGAYLDLLPIVDKIVYYQVSSLEELHSKAEVVNKLVRFKNSLCSDLLDFQRILSKSEKQNLIQQINEKLQVDKYGFESLLSSDYTESNLYAEAFKQFGTFLKAESWHLNASFQNTYESPEQSKKVADMIRDAIQSKSSFSLVRLGDGEGNFLDYQSELKNYQSEDQCEIQKIWWKHPKFEQNKEDSTMLQLYRQAVDHCDILGVVPERVMLQVHNKLSEKNKELHVVRGNLAVLQYVLKDKNQRKCYTSSKIHADLESWALYPYILSEVEKVTCITCHRGIGQYLENVIGVADTKVIHIPSEKRYQGFFGYEETNNHYPERYQEILDQLKEETIQGEVYLIGAGFLGKIYCEVVRQAGGIAIDVGSIFDLWMGHYTRKLFDINPEQNGITFKYNKSINLTPHSVVKSNFYRTKNLRVQKASEKKELEFLITCHPRSGSLYCSRWLSKLGYDVQHERVGEHGICSWLHAVEDENTPFFIYSRRMDSRDSRSSFSARKHIHLIRDPFSSIPSICVENTNNVSYQYRRFHIFRIFGVDLDGFSSSLEKAIASYLYWNEIIENQKPDGVIKLESIESDLKTFIEENDYFLKEEKDFQDDVLDKNTTTSKYLMQKPIIEREHYHAVDPALMKKLSQFCDRYDYFM